MSLVVCAGTHDDPAEHGVAAVPDFGLDGRTPAPLGKLGIFVTPVLYGIVEDRASNRRVGPVKLNEKRREKGE